MTTSFGVPQVQALVECRLAIGDSAVSLIADGGIKRHGSLAQALLQATGLPLAAPSANPSGRLSPTSAEQVRDQVLAVSGLRVSIQALGTLRQQNNPAWLVFDAEYLAKYPVAGSTPGVPADWMVSAAGLPHASHTRIVFSAM